MQSKGTRLVVIAFVCACRPENRPDPAEARHAIDSLNTRLVAFYSAGQADSAAQIFAQDVWALPPNSTPIVGRDSLRSYQNKVFAAGKWQFDLKTDDVAVADSLATERGHYTLKVTAGPRRLYPSFEDRGNYIVLWRKESDGHWRQVWEAKVSTLPLPMPPASVTGKSKKT
jgi:ketosteroid isomerase-like protein